MHDWEYVEGRGDCGDTWRMRVPGGWLYRIRECSNRDGVPTVLAMTFVPLPSEDILRQQALQLANQEIIEQITETKGTVP